MTDVKKTNQNIDDRQKRQELLLSFLEYPGESPEVDYKASVAFDGKSDFSLKLIRHVLGIANNGGGYLVIGFPEGSDSKPQCDPNISEEVSSSYEATKFPQIVSKKIRGTDKPDIRIHHIPFQGKTYPIVEIAEFEKRPFFCNSEHVDSDGKLILRQGALYIRTANSNTEEISSPEEWDKLIQLSMRKRNDELLDRFSTLLEQVQKGTVSLPAKKNHDKKPPEWFAQQREIAESAMKKDEFEPSYFEVTSYLSQGNKSWKQTELLDAMTKGALRNTGWPQGVVLYVDDKKPKVVKNGIQTTISSKNYHPMFDHWGISKKGAYYFCRTYHEDYEEGKQVPTLGFDTRIWRIAEAIDHTYSVYSQLGVDPQEPIVLEITHKGLKGRYLNSNNPHRIIFSDRISEEEEATWRVETTLDELRVKRKSFIHEAIKDLTVYFDFFELQPDVIDSVIEEYDTSRL